jgi:hypothetical protein
VHNYPMFHHWGLTMWFQNPNVCHRVYKSLLPAHILNQLHPVNSLPTHLPKIHSDTNLSTSVSSKCLSLLLSFRLKACTLFLSSAMHATCPVHLTLYGLIWLTFWMSIKYEAPHCATNSILLWLHPSCHMYHYSCGSQKPNVRWPKPV